jgi:hypothetical protein
VFDQTRGRCLGVEDITKAVPPAILPARAAGGYVIRVNGYETLIIQCALVAAVKWGDWMPRFWLPTRDYSMGSSGRALGVRVPTKTPGLGLVSRPGAVRLTPIHAEVGHRQSSVP